MTVAQRKLLILSAAATLEDANSPLGNRLEALKGDRASQHSFRINHQWRVCFIWQDDGPHDVEMTDYWYLVPTVEGNLRLLGLGAGVAKAMQVAVAVPVVVLTWRAFRRGATDLALATLCVGTFLVTPHAFVYDLSLAVAGIGWFLHDRLAASGGLNVFAATGMLAVLLLPVAMMTGLGQLPLAVPALALLLAAIVASDRRASPPLSALPPSA